MQINSFVGVFILIFYTVFSLPYNGYWTYDQWKKSLPLQVKARKRSFPGLEQQYKEISIDTGKLYNDFVKAFASDSNETNDNNDPERRTLLRSKSPSIANIDSNIDLHKTESNNNKKGQQRQYIGPGSSYSNSPSLASFDPFLKTQLFAKDKQTTSYNNQPSNVAPPVASMNLPPHTSLPSPPSPGASGQSANKPVSNLINPQVTVFNQELLSRSSQDQSQNLPTSYFASDSSPSSSPKPPAVSTPAPQTATNAQKATGSKVELKAIQPIHHPTAPNSNASPFPDSVFNMPGSFDIQAFDAEVVPDGKGGMKILDVKSSGDNNNKNKDEKAKKTMNGKPVMEKVINNPRNTQTTIPVVDDKSLSQPGSKRVYSLGDHIFSDVGCFLDKWMRSIPTLEGNHPLLMDSDYKARTDPLQKCAEAALDKGYRVFGLQNGGQCFAGQNGENRYNIYGPSPLCKDDGLGGTWANEVYMYNNEPKFAEKKPEPQAHETGGAKDIFPETSNTLKTDSKNEDDDYDGNLLKEEQELSETDTPIKDKSKTDPSSFKGTLGKIVSKALKDRENTDIVRKKQQTDFAFLKQDHDNDFDMVRIKPAAPAEKSDKPKKLVDLFRSKNDNGDIEEINNLKAHNKEEFKETELYKPASVTRDSDEDPKKDGDSLKAVKELFKTAVTQKHSDEKALKENKNSGNSKKEKDENKTEQDAKEEVKNILKETSKEVDKGKQKVDKEDSNSIAKIEKEKEKQKEREKEAEKEAEKQKISVKEKEKETESVKAKEKEKEESNVSTQNMTALSRVANDITQKEPPKPFPLGAAVAHGERPPCICPDKVCSSKLDLAFVIDASAGSEQGGKDKMAELMEFGRRVASAFKVAPEESRVGLVTYATDAQIMMNFHRFSDPDALTEARNAVRVKPHTGKYTGQALSLAKEGLFDTGHRSDALDVLILMTDGPSSDDVTAPARALRDMGVKIICVGVGPQIDKAQLNDMASDPDEGHVFVADYDNLATIIRKTQRAACVGGTLRDPVNSCNCDQRNAINDRQTVAFYNMYKTAVESPFYDEDAVVSKYQTIARPERTFPRTYKAAKNRYAMKNPRQIIALKPMLPLRYITNNAVQERFPGTESNPEGKFRKDIIRTGKSRSLPLDNPHPRVVDASPLVELSLKDRAPKSDTGLQTPGSALTKQAKSEEGYQQSQDFIQAVATSPDEMLIPDQASKSNPLPRPDSNLNNDRSNTQKPEDLYKSLMSEADSKLSKDDIVSPLRSKEKEFLIDQYLKSHRAHENDKNADINDITNKKSQENNAIEKEFKNTENDQSKETEKHEKSSSELINDDHIPINTEGKKHLSEEEQVLGNTKPHEAAGGAHHLPLETMEPQDDESFKTFNKIESKLDTRKPSRDEENIKPDKLKYHDSQRDDHVKGLPLINPGGEFSSRIKSDKQEDNDRREREFQNLKLTGDIENKDTEKFGAYKTREKDDGNQSNRGKENFDNEERINEINEFKASKEQVKISKSGNEAIEMEARGQNEDLKKDEENSEEKYEREEKEFRKLLDKKKQVDASKQELPYNPKKTEDENITNRDEKEKKLNNYDEKQDKYNENASNKYDQREKERNSFDDKSKDFNNNDKNAENTKQGGNNYKEIDNYYKNKKINYKDDDSNSNGNSNENQEYNQNNKNDNSNNNSNNNNNNRLDNSARYNRYNNKNNYDGRNDYASGNDNKNSDSNEGTNNNQLNKFDGSKKYKNNGDRGSNNRENDGDSENQNKNEKNNNKHKSPAITSFGNIRPSKLPDKQEDDKSEKSVQNVNGFSGNNLDDPKTNELLNLSEDRMHDTENGKQQREVHSKSSKDAGKENLVKTEFKDEETNGNQPFEKGYSENEGRIKDEKETEMHEKGSTKDLDQRKGKSDETKTDGDLMTLTSKEKESRSKGSISDVLKMKEAPVDFQTSEFGEYNIMKQPELTEDDKEQLHAIQTTLMNADSQFLSNGPLQQYRVGEKQVKNISTNFPLQENEKNDPEKTDTPKAKLGRYESDEPSKQQTIIVKEKQRESIDNANEENRDASNSTVIYPYEYVRKEPVKHKKEDLSQIIKYKHEKSVKTEKQLGHEQMTDVDMRESLASKESDKDIDLSSVKEMLRKESNFKEEQFMGKNKEREVSSFKVGLDDMEMQKDLEKSGYKDFNTIKEDSEHQSQNNPGEDNQENSHDDETNRSQEKGKKQKYSHRKLQSEGKDLKPHSGEESEGKQNLNKNRGREDKYPKEGIQEEESESQSLKEQQAEKMKGLNRYSKGDKKEDTDMTTNTKSNSNKEESLPGSMTATNENPDSSENSVTDNSNSNSKTVEESKINEKDLSKGLDIYNLIDNHKESVKGHDKEYFYYGKGAGVTGSEYQIEAKNGDSNSNESEDKQGKERKGKTEDNKQNENNNQMIRNIGTSKTDLTDSSVNGFSEDYNRPTYLNRGSDEESQEREKYIESKYEKLTSHEDEAKMMQSNHFKNGNLEDRQTNVNQNYQNGNGNVVQQIPALVSSDTNSDNNNMNGNNNNYQENNDNNDENSNKEHKYKVYTANDNNENKDENQNNESQQNNQQSNDAESESDKPRQGDPPNVSDNVNNDSNNNAKQNYQQNGNQENQSEEPNQGSSSNWKILADRNKGKQLHITELEKTKTKEDDDNKNKNDNKNQFINKNSMEMLKNQRLEDIVNFFGSKNDLTGGKEVNDEQNIKEQQRSEKENSILKKFADTSDDSNHPVSSRNEEDTDHSVFKSREDLVEGFARHEEEDHDKLINHISSKNKENSDEKVQSSVVDSKNMEQTSNEEFRGQVPLESSRDIFPKTDHLVKETNPFEKGDEKKPKGEKRTQNQNNLINKSSMKVKDISEISRENESNKDEKELPKNVAYLTFYKSSQNTHHNHFMDNPRQPEEYPNTHARPTAHEISWIKNELANSGLSPHDIEEQEEEYKKIVKDKKLALSPTLSVSKGDEVVELKQNLDSPDIASLSHPTLVTDRNNNKRNKLISSRIKDSIPGGKRGQLTAEQRVTKHHISRKDEPIDPAWSAKATTINPVNAVKKDSTEKGILTSDPFLEVTHYWPFVTSHTLLTPDILTGHNAIVMENAEIRSDKDFGEYLSTERKGSYVIAGDFKGTCFSDPGKCIMGGLTISFWVYLDESKIRKEQDAYIISSGGQSKKSRGFAFLYFHGNYTACLSTADKQWKMTITELPQKEWINIVFLWQKNEQLTYYLNGEKKDSVEGTSTSRPTVKFTILTISRPNNAVNVEFMYPLRMSSLALWDKWLNDEQVKACFNSLKKFRKNPALRRKRSKILTQYFQRKLTASSKRHEIKHA